MLLGPPLLGCDSSAIVRAAVHLRIFKLQYVRGPTNPAAKSLRRNPRAKPWGPSISSTAALRISVVDRPAMRCFSLATSANGGTIVCDGRHVVGNAHV